VTWESGDSVQNTLLGIAIVLIAALAAALIGPHFVDWNGYRAEFEFQASRLSEAQVRIGGAIQARLLPTPTLTLEDVEIASAGQSRPLRVHKLGVEFKLGSVLRGEWRATEVRLEGAEFAASIDSSGRLVSALPIVGERVETISIDRFEILDGVAALADERSNSRALLEHVEFKGELRSITGPAKGEGSFDLDGIHYPFRLALARAAEAGAAHIHLNLDPSDRPSAELDATITVEGGIPRLEGTMEVSRPIRAAPDGMLDSWRLTSHLKGDNSRIEFDQVEFQYGPEDRVIKLRGGAALAFGREPQLRAHLAAMQIDFDRMLALPESSRRHPLVAIKALADYFNQARLLPIPVKLDIGVDGATLAGATLGRINGGINVNSDSWGIDVEFRAPGATQVGVHGRLAFGANGIAYSGSANIEARDRRAFLSWLNDHPDGQASATGPLHLQGNLNLSSETVAIDALKADLDGMNVEGRLAYHWASGGEPPRLEAALDAPELDVDRTGAVARDLLGNIAFDFPRKGRISIKVGKAVIAGVDAKRTDIAIRLDGEALEIERFIVADFGGTALSSKGRIDLRGANPRGTLTFDVNAQALDGLPALLAKFVPGAGADLRNRLARLVPARVGITISVDDPKDRNVSPVFADIKVEGRAGPIRIAFQGRSGLGETPATSSLWKLGEAKTIVTGRLDAPEGRQLLDLLGLEPAFAGDDRPATLSLAAEGRFDGEMLLDAQLIGLSTNIASRGTVRLSGNAEPTAKLGLKINNANLRTPRPGQGNRAELLPAALKAQVTVGGGNVTVEDLAGTVGDSNVAGHLQIGLQSSSVSGALDVGEINLPAALGAVLGAPVGGTSSATPWSAEPFERGLFGKWSGRIELNSPHASLLPTLAAKKLKFVMRLDDTNLDIEEIDGILAGGRVAGSMHFETGSTGMTARSRLTFDGADLAELIRGGPPPLSGRIKASLEVAGTGRSPFALLGSLSGRAIFTLADGTILHLDPAAFETVIRSVDQGLPIELARISQRADEALNKGRISLPPAEGEIAIDEGRARLKGLTARLKDGDIALAGEFALAEDVLDASVTLIASERRDAPSGLRPEITVSLKGGVEAPDRTLDTASFTHWLALRAVEQQTKRLDALESGHDGQSPAGTTAPATNAPVSNGPAERKAARTPRPRSAATQAPLNLAPSREPRTEPRRPAAPPRPLPPPWARGNTWGVFEP
jgi:large subunit ribosomal protein L24